MLNQLVDRLTSVRIRQQLNRGFHFALWGLLLGAIVGCGLLVFQRAGILEAATFAWLGVLVAATLGLAAGLLWPTRWNSTTHLVDQSYGLKDRTTTAFEFASRRPDDELRALQIADALEHLRGVEASRVVPFRLPRVAGPAVCGLVLMFGVALLPTKRRAVAEVPEALPVVLEQAAVLEQTMLQELKNLADEQPDKELEQLTEELEQLTEELKQPEVDQREVLAKLSEMQQSLADALQQLDVEQVDAQLKQLAEALKAADATQAASQSLEAGNYDQAASELEKIDASTMDRKQRKALTDNLAKLSKNLSKGQQGQLSDSVAEMVKGLESENNSQCKSGMCKAAGVCRSQSVRKKIGECLARQLNRLSECKSQCQGNCEGGKPSNKVAKSDSPSQRWGTGASGKPLGEEKTSIDSQRQQEHITGISGDGPTERETLATPEARQDAARSYQDRYADFKKQMEEVIDSEPLPLGHRQTVRTYFESIRPQTGDDLLVDGK
ncbi:MAG: hypothetical protein R6U98_08285 [Pirellulaceae bacterium]